MSFQRQEQIAARSVRMRMQSHADSYTADTGDADDGPLDHMVVTQFVTIDKAASITGLTAKAIRRKIEQGVWLEHREWKRGPDGRIYIDIKGYTRWVKAWRQ